MQHILNYIKNGKGGGLKIVMIWLLFMAIFVGGGFYYGVKSQFNGLDLQKVIDKMPTITVKNGVIDTVDNLAPLALPAGAMYQEIVFDIPQQIDSATFNEKTIYITPTTIHLYQNNAWMQYKLPDSLGEVITPAVFSHYVHMSFIVLAIMAGGIFIVFGILGFFITLLLVNAFSFIIKEGVAFSLLGRATAYPWLVALMGYTAGYFLDFNISIYYVFIVPFLWALLMIVSVNEKK